MKLMLPSSVSRLVVVSLVVSALPACSLFRDYDPEYKTLQARNPLEIPPDLSQLQKEDRYAVPGAAGTRSATASQIAGSQTQAARPGVLPTVKVARIERAGNQRWLLVQEPPEKVLPTIREFWQQAGFKISLEDRDAGILETDWTEDRMRMPKTGLRAFLGRFGEALLDTGERDRYRVRLERVDGGTEVYLSHRGAVETANREGDQTFWLPRPNDPNLEAMYLQKLLVKFGGDELKPVATATGAAPAVAAAPLVERARLVTDVSGARVQLDDTLDRAWRRVGLALDRSGFTVEERDRANGRYVVRYVDPTADKEEPGFFARLFGKSKDVKPQQYRVWVKPAGTLVQVSAEPAAALPAGEKDASNRILELLHDDLK